MIRTRVGYAGGLKCSVQDLALIGRDRAVAITVDDQKRWVILIDIRDRIHTLDPQGIGEYFASAQ